MNLKRRKFKIAKIGSNFDKELEDIIRRRRMTTDKNEINEISKARLTDGIPQTDEWKEIKRKLILQRRRREFQ